MKKYRYLFLPLSFLVVFVVFTILVKNVDVNTYSPSNTLLGFYKWNMAVDNWVYDMNVFYTMKIMSNIIFYISFAFPLFFGILFIVEWIKRKSLKAIDRSLYIVLVTSTLACFVYFLFLIFKVNYSPLSVPGKLKASFPSSHVFLGCVFYASGVATIYDMIKISNKGLKAGISLVTIFLLLLLGFVRMLSRHHWISDIVGAYLVVAFLLSVFFTLRHYLIVSNEKESPEAQ